MNDVDTGALGPSGRFARMEASLDRIEQKLDLKADTSRVLELEAKHNALEASIARMVSGETTSPLGQLYLQRFTEMEASIESLEQKDMSRQAVAEASKEAGEARYKFMLWAMAIGSIVNIGFSVGTRLLAV